MKKILQWYIEVWVDGIENYEKNRHKHGGYIERTLKLLLASSWLRSLAISSILFHTKYRSSAFIVLIILFVLNYPFTSRSATNNGFDVMKFSKTLLKLDFGCAFLLKRKKNSFRYNCIFSFETLW